MINGQSLPTGSEACFFNPAAFAAPSGSYGNAGPDILHYEHFQNMDFSLMNNVPVNERNTLQLCFEAFKVSDYLHYQHAAAVDQTPSPTPEN
jgi:hypothetical protein